MSTQPHSSSAGRPSKGERDHVGFKAPVDDKRHWEKEADALGIALGSWIVYTVNRAAGLPTPLYVEQEIRAAQLQREQTQLPMEPMARSA